MSMTFDSSQSAELDPPAPWTAHYPFCIPAHLDYPEEPVWWLLERAATQFPERIALRYFGEKITYAELRNLAARAASMYQSLGVKPGDRVGLLLPNLPEYLMAAYGVWMAGGVVVSLSPLSVAEEISGLLAATDCRFVVCLDLLSPLLTTGEHKPDQVLTCSVAPRLPWYQRIGYNGVLLRRGARNFHGVKHADFREELQKYPPIDTPFPADLQSPAYILPTGGTTGKPKAVTLSHRNLVANAWQLFYWCGQRTGRDTLLAVIPFFHSYGLSTCVTSGLAMGATLVLFHRFHAKKTLELIENTQPTVFPTVPAMLHQLNQQMRKTPRNLKSLMWVISGGAPLTKEIAEEFAETSRSHVVEGYGLSEASPVTHVNPLDGTERSGFIGLPLPDVEARILDPENGESEMPTGEVGELVIRGPQVMLGYWNNPEATQAAIRDGWLFTGDLARMDRDGFFQIVDRKKDLIITSGFNVYPSDVEAVLRNYPGVKDAAVIGVPDPQRGEIVKAVIAISDPAKFHRHELDHYIEQHLAHHKRPKLIEICEGDLPRNFLGKVLRRKLRDTPTVTAK
ncbi:MAG: long-chain fatty acid--CoA ligase [Planctomycetaceae bacterium]